MLIVNQCLGTKICGQACYFLQMLCNINTLRAMSSSICAFYSLGLVTDGNRGMEQFNKTTTVYVLADFGLRFYSPWEIFWFSLVFGFKYCTVSLFFSNIKLNSHLLWICMLSTVKVFIFSCPKYVLFEFI